jgi:hypothetical protein
VPGAVGAAIGCDGGGRVPDAQTQPAAYSAELSVRFEVSRSARDGLGARRSARRPPDPRPTSSGLVDPLAAAAPDQGCVLRDVDLTNRALAPAAAPSISRSWAASASAWAARARRRRVMRTFPRVYPDVAGVVGGVVGEAAPQQIAALPEHVSLISPDSELPVGELAVPALPKLLAINGSSPTAGLRVDAAAA